MPSGPQRSPGAIAIERMAKLASAGAPASRMLAAVDEVLIQWASEDLDPEEMRDRVEQLQNDIDGGIQAAQDYVAEADTEKGKVSATAQLAGLETVRDRLAAAIEGRK